MALLRCGSADKTYAPISSMNFNLRPRDYAYPPILPLGGYKSLTLTSVESSVAVSMYDENNTLIKTLTLNVAEDVSSYDYVKLACPSGSYNCTLALS